MTQIGTLELIASIDTTRYKRGASEIESDNKKIEKSSERSFKNVSSSAANSFGAAANSILAFAKVATAALVGGAVGIGAFVKEASELQSVRASFESLTGSIDTARGIIKDLNTFSLTTAFSSADINSSARTLLGFGVSADKLLTIMKQLGDVAGATGGNLSSLALVTGQVFAQGRLQAQDYYQIINSGAGSLAKELRNVVKEKTGLNDIKEAFEDGLVTAEMYAIALERSNSAGGFAFEGAIKQSKTFEGQVSNLLEGINNIGLSIIGVDRTSGDIKTGGIFDRISKSVAAATKWLTDNKEEIIRIANIIIDNFIPAVTALGVAFVAAKVAAIGFSIAASANPIGLIAAAIVILIGALTFLQLKFDWIGKSIEWLTNVTRPLVDLFNRYLLPVIQLIAGIVGGVFKEAFTNIIQAFKDLWLVLEPYEPYLKKIGIAIIVGMVAPLVILIATIAAVVTAIVGIVTAITWVAGKIAQFVSYTIGLFITLRNGIANVFSNIGVAVANTITNVVTTAINYVIRRAASLVNGFVDSINSVVGLLNKLPGVNIGTVGKLPIPQLAKGGIVSSATLAMIGEGSEPEAVIPLSKLDKMLNNSGEGGGREYNIGVINIGSEVDGERWLRKLTENQEIVSGGLTPPQKYMAA